jgi:hypothetical protein
MLSDRARTELSVAVDIFQESLLYNCITKESDHLMCHWLVFTKVSMYSSAFLKVIEIR